MSEELQGATDTPEAPEALSVHDALMAKLGNDEHDADEDAPDEGNAESPEDEQSEGDGAETPTEDTGLHEVEYDGKTYKLPPELKDAFLRQQDYTRKTQEVAEARKAADAQRQTYEALGQTSQEEMDLRIKQQMLGEQLKIYDTALTDELLQTDPIQYMRLDKQRRDLQQTGFGLSQALQQAQAKAQHLRGEAFRKLLTDGAAQLKKSIPDWSEDKAKALREYATAQAGYAPDEINQLTDHRFVVLLNKAAELDALKASKPAVTKRVEALPKVAKPGAAPRVTDREIQQKKALSALKQNPNKRGALADYLALRLKD